MKASVSGITLQSIEDVVWPTLTDYHYSTNGRVVFDIPRAARLELTPDKPNAARSASAIRFLGGVAGTLFVIVFGPGDGTGDESTHRLADIKTGAYPQATKIVPRAKTAAHSEAHLTLASFPVDEQTAGPVLFAGNLHALGLTKGKIRKLGELGQRQTHFQQIMARDQLAVDPAVTLTTGYRGVLAGDRKGKRFGDPHAVYNPHRDVLQVCGFIALAPETANQHLDMFRELQAVELGRTGEVSG